MHDEKYGNQLQEDFKKSISSLTLTTGTCGAAVVAGRGEVDIK